MSVTGLVGMFNLRNLFPCLLTPNEIFAGTPAVFRLRLENSKKFLPSFLIHVEALNSSGVTVPVVGSGSTFKDMIAITFPERGQAAIGRITVSSTFPVGFFVRYWTFNMENQVIVFPRLLPSAPSGTGEGKEKQGDLARLSRGVDGELERIAEYSGAEPLRLIHWKLSARSDNLQIKEFGRLSVQPLIIDLQEVSGQTVEERISRAAWQVRHVIRERPVGLKLGSRIIPAGSGNRHSIQLLTELALYGKA